MPDAIIHHPTIINLGPLPLTGFGLAVLLAFVIAQIIAQQELTRRGHLREANAVSDLILACVLGTLIGGKIYYVSVISHDWHDFFTRPSSSGRIHARSSAAGSPRGKKLSYVSTRRGRDLHRGRVRRRPTGCGRWGTTMASLELGSRSPFQRGAAVHRRHMERSSAHRCLEGCLPYV